ncbi:tRNA dimethylallyltransferase [Synchytrium microbalum]|uniref:tRNA dimethylallyltransferase n=1 Tax=Synchytrium microbalum TaxID=1806994 RepID=A0A507C7G4_9FUNG|nr:tRNA dimethylallyltransferase [Synchytrium microbalum]TPX37510.1 tRNA dimethylallyltransferase [Synchytrium microbalum]
MKDAFVFAIVGTTGVGKSKLAIELAKAINGEVINADSMQVYTGLDTVTNKIPVLERDGIPHHLMDFVDWNEEYSVIDFSKDANNVIADIHGKGKHPILVGGTHYYMQSLLWKNMLIGDSTAASDTESKNAAHPSLSEELRTLIEPTLRTPESGRETEHDAEMYRVLQRVDPVMGERWHPNDTRKIRRSLEVYYTTATKHSEWLETQRQSNIESNCSEDNEESGTMRYPSCVFWIYAQPTILDPRLDHRVDAMISTGGMFDELRTMMDAWQAKRESDGVPDYTRGIFQTIGFKEFHDYLMATSNAADAEKLKEDGITAMKIATRQYARRQTNWIKNRLGPRVFDEKRRGNRFGFYVLDATDLSKWDENVGRTAIDIAKKLPPSSSLLSELIPQINPQASLSVHEWKKHTCDVCVDSHGQPRVLNGPLEWEKHVAGRQHKKRVEYVRKDLGAWKRRGDVAPVVVGGVSTEGGAGSSSLGESSGSDDDLPLFPPTSMPDLSIATRTKSVRTPFENEVRNEAWSNVESASNPNGVLWLATAENHFSADIIAQRLNTFRSAITESDCFYPAVECGSLELRQALSRFIGRHFESYQDIGNDNLVVTSGGCTSLVALLGKAICNCGDVMLAPTPVYRSFESMLAFIAGAQLVGVPHDPSSSKLTLSVSAFEQVHQTTANVKGIILTNPNNPTALIYSKDEIANILNWAASKGLHVIVDEVYGLSTFGESTFESILSFPGLDDKVHWIWSATKDLCCPGLRMGVLHTRHPQILAIMKQWAAYTPFAPLSERLIVPLLNDDEWISSFIDQNRSNLRNGANHVGQLLQSAGIPCVIPEAGFYVWLDLSMYLKNQSFEGERVLWKRLASGGVMLVNGESCLATRPGFFRMTTMKPEVMDVAVNRIKVVLMAYSKL